ncbi:MAG: hypothetical protein H0T48_00245 [Gemmatimonadaceae bacterium]|nr:hypothetical protein [Gemmatimonadaceae bacterium]
MNDHRPRQRWRLLLVPPRSGAENMARDAALMGRAGTTGETVFSVYSWTFPTLSLGRNEEARGRYDLNLISARGIDVVRRPTGGRALLHHREVTYSVTAPIDPRVPLRESCHRINAVLAAGLAALGAPVAEADPKERTPAPGATPCFAAPARGELVAGGRKLVGSAQWRNNGALLQHGSILIHDDQSSIAGLAIGSPLTAASARPATLASLLGYAPTLDDVAAALFGAVRALEDAEPTEMDEDEIRATALTLVQRYKSERWTWRR